MSVHQLKDGRWVCQYPKGKDISRPTTNKKYFGRGSDAERKAIEFNLSLGLGTRPQISSPTFTELANEYLAAKQNSMASSTHTTICGSLERTIIPLIGSARAHSLTPAALDQYVAARSKTVKNTTIHRELSDIRAIIRWSVKRGLIVSNPMSGFDMPKRDDARIMPPTREEFEAILRCAVPHMKRAMLISYNVGLRPGKELLSLTWESIDFINKTLTVISADKGGIPLRMVPLNKTLLSHLHRWYEEDNVKGTRYIVHYNGYRINSLKKAWASAKKRAKITRRIRMYDMRHAFITQLLEKGADLKSVAEIAGHSPEMTLRIYQHVSTDLKRAAVELLE